MVFSLLALLSKAMPILLAYIGRGRISCWITCSSFDVCCTMWAVALRIVLYWSHLLWWTESIMWARLPCCVCIYAYAWIDRWCSCCSFVQSFSFSASIMFKLSAGLIPVIYRAMIKGYYLAAVVSCNCMVFTRFSVRYAQLWPKNAGLRKDY